MSIVLLKDRNQGCSALATVIACRAKFLLDVKRRNQKGRKADSALLLPDMQRDPGGVAA